MNYHIKNFIIPIHLLSIISIVLISVGLVPFSWLYFFAGWTLIYGLGLVVGFHKLLSHRSFTTNKYVAYVLAYLGCLGISGSPIWWSAIHRGHHHAHTETERDLQTPRKGWLNSYIGWQFGDETSKISYPFLCCLC
jgi:stearoyl-CoA desaturase (delta-9 desaturase)